jgi:glycosyltransferase involved in cell wall biosynthesis
VLKNRNFLLRRLLFANNINIISHIISPTSIPGEYKDIRSIGWIPDFQHKLLPEFNSPAVCTVRDKLNNLLFSKCSTVVVSSNSAKAHAMKFYNFVHEKIHVLQFAVNTLPVSDLVSNSELQEKFNYSGRFLYLPNQYWAHKNHRIVIDAINSLRKQGKRVLVISTGITNDYRHPELFNSIQSYVKELGVGDQYRILGPIPYRFVHSFMVNCVSIINPSNFEGWSTTVEEGKALGKMLILSKIDVHLEQNPPRCIYFDQSNAEELAQAMWNTWDSFDPEVEKKEMEEAKLVSKDRVKQFGQRFQKIALGDMIID